MCKNSYDTIIIGSGISGMAAGIMLAKEGEKVIVLEQHSVAGGMTQTYSRQGITFPTGVHRLGSLEPGQPLWYYFNYLDLMDRLDFVKLSNECFEKFYFPSKSYEVPTGHARYRQKLIEYFPNQKRSINTYFSDFKNVISNIGMYDPSVAPEKDLSLKYCGSLADYLIAIGVSGRLNALLTANNPLYGIPSNECPLLTHFLVSDSYLNSSFRINELTTPFSRALSDSFKSKGGEICVGSHVKQLMVQDKTAVGIILSNSEKLLARKVIFSGHPSLILDLCPKELFRPVFQKRLNKKNTPGIFGVALKWDKNSCPLKKNDVYIYDSWNVNYQYERTNILGDDPLGMVYLSALPNSGIAGKGNKEIAVTALIGINDKETDMLKKYYKQPGKSHYKTAKNKIIQKILNHIKPVHPEIVKDALVVDSYSPMTFQRYTLTKGGSAYGIRKTARHFLEGMFSPATKIKNFYLTGQSIGFNGIHGSIVSSVKLCQMIIGEKYLTDKIMNTKLKQ
jgi:all-trans-retinol 13,14-reductase